MDSRKGLQADEEPPLTLQDPSNLGYHTTERFLLMVLILKNSYCWFC